MTTAFTAVYPEAIHISDKVDILDVIDDNLAIVTITTVPAFNKAKTLLGNLRKDCNKPSI